MKITVSLTPELAATIRRKERQLREGQSIAGLALRLGPDGGLLLYQPAEKNREAADILLADLRRASEQKERDKDRGIDLGPGA